MKRPSFQFYPGDWLANGKLRRCSFAEKGLWIEVMCLLHSQPEYGVIRWVSSDIAKAIGCRPRELQSLAVHGVLKGHDVQLPEAYVYVPRSGRRDGNPVVLIDNQPGPIWYSSRMVRDEYVASKRGGIGEAPKPAPKPPLGDSPKPPFDVHLTLHPSRARPSSSSSSSSSASPREEIGALATAVPTVAGACAMAMRAAGLGVTNPSHPDMLALIAAGATETDFADGASEAVERGKGFAYALGVVKGRRAEAAKAAKATSNGNGADTGYGYETRADKAKRERIHEITGGLASRKPKLKAPDVPQQEITDASQRKLD